MTATLWLLIALSGNGTNSGYAAALARFSGPEDCRATMRAINAEQAVYARVTILCVPAKGVL